MNYIETNLVQCISHMPKYIPFVERGPKGTLKKIVGSKYDHYHFKIVPINEIGRELLEQYEIVIPNAPFQEMFCAHNYIKCLKKEDPIAWGSEWSTVVKYTKPNFKRISAIDWTISTKNGYIYSYKFNALLYNCEHYHSIRVVYKSCFHAIIKFARTLYKIRNRKKGIRLFFLATTDPHSPLSRFRHSIHTPVTSRVVSYLGGHKASAYHSLLSSSSSIQLTI